MNEFISTAHPARAGMLIKSLPMLLNLLPSFLLMSEILKKMNAAAKTSFI